MDFMNKDEVPTGAKLTYASFACDHGPLKEKCFRVRITVGGDEFNYEDEAGSQATKPLETTIVFNSTMSDANKGARVLSLDIKYSFYSTPRKNPDL